MRVALYARVSTGKQAERDLSIQKQVEQMMAYCKREGLDIAGIYSEEGASSRFNERPVFRKMICEVMQSSKQIDTILTMSMGSFFHDENHAVIYKHLLNRNGVSVVTVQDEVFATSMSCVIDNILTLFNEYESELYMLKTESGEEVNVQ